METDAGNLNTAEAILNELRGSARPDQLSGMKRYGMTIENRLGVSVPQMRALAKKAGRNHQLALELWKTKIAEAMIVAALIDDPQQVSSQQMDTWVLDFASWDVCDQVCMNLFDKTPLAWHKVNEWAERGEEFVKRAAFALLACLAWHNKSATNHQFIQFLPLIEKHADDERNFVKKAVSWALRHIGKRNRALHQQALQTANKLAKSENKTARWIGSDALRDLNSASTLRRMQRDRC